MPDSNIDHTQSDSLCVSVILSELEADLAYCDARLTLIGNDPDTPYQKAQYKAFKILEEQLGEELAKQQQARESLRQQ